MAWNLVQSVSGSVTSSVTSPEAVTFPNPNQAGNLLVLQVQLDSPYNGAPGGAPVITGVTDTSGNTYNLPPGVTHYDMTNAATSAVYYAYSSIAGGANTVDIAFDTGVSYVTGNSSSGTASSFSAAFTPTAIGQVILVWCATLDAGGVTMTVLDDQSNVYTNAIAYHTANGSIYLWWAVASTTAATTYTVSVSGSVAATSFADVYAGVSPNGPIDVHQGAPQVGVGTSTSPAGGSILPSFYGEWLVTGMIPAGGIITDPVGYMNRQTESTVSAQSSDSNAAVAIGAAQAPTWSLSSPNQWLAFNVLLVPSGPPVSAVYYFLSEWENTAGAVTTDPIDGAAWGMQEFSNPAVPPQILLPTSGPDDLILLLALTMNGAGAILGQIGGVNATLLGTSGNVYSEYAQTSPYSTPGFAPGITPCTTGQPVSAWSGTAVAFRFGGNPNTSKLPILVDSSNTPIVSASALSVRLQMPCAAGDLIVLAVNSASAVSSISDSAGNTYHMAVSSNPNSIWYAYNIASSLAGNVVTVVFAAPNSGYLAAHRYTNVVSTSDPLDQAGITPQTSGTSGYTPTVTTTLPNEVVYAMWTTGPPFWPELAGGASTWNYLYNIRDAASNSEQVELDLILGAPSAIVSTGAVDGGGFWGCAIVTFEGRALFISSQPTSQTAAVGITATFSVTAIASSGSLSYQWQRNGSNIIGATSSSYTTTALGVGDSGTYTCVVTDSYGSTESQPAQLYVSANPGGGIGIPTLGQVAEGEIPAGKVFGSVILDSMNF